MHYSFHILSRLAVLFSILFVCCTAEAAKRGEYGPQENIYYSEWAELKHKAELGDPDALFTLGNYYYQPPRGSNFRKNIKKAAEFYFKSAIRGNPAAQYNFGYLLHKGLGVTQNTVESYAWFKLASNNQSPVSKHINNVSKKAVVMIENQMDALTLEKANKRMDFLADVIAKERYRKVKFPG